MDIDAEIIATQTGHATRALRDSGLLLPIRARLQGSAQKRLAESGRDVARISDEQDLSTARNEAEILQVYADKILSIADGLGIDDPAIVGRWFENAAFNGIRSQSNIEVIASKADEMVGDSDEVPTEGPSDDWMHRFYEAGRVVSEGELQDFFAAMLAGEIKEPGNVSFQTIEVAKRLDPDLAVLFRKWASMSIGYDFDGSRFLCTLGMDVGTNAFNELGLSYVALNKLRDIGLISTQSAVFGGFEVPPHRFLAVIYVGKSWRMERIDETDKGPVQMKLPCILASVAGSELAQVVPVVENLHYTNRLHGYLETQGFRLTRVSPDTASHATSGKLND